MPLSKYCLGGEERVDVCVSVRSAGCCLAPVFLSRNG